MKILDIREDPDDPDMNILHYELTEDEEKMLKDLSDDTNKDVETLIYEAFMRSVKNFQGDVNE